MVYLELNKKYGIIYGPNEDYQVARGEIGENTKNLFRIK